MFEVSAHNNPTIIEKNPSGEEIEQHHFRGYGSYGKTNKENGANV